MRRRNTAREYLMARALTDPEFRKTMNEELCKVTQDVLKEEQVYERTTKIEDRIAIELSKALKIDVCRDSAVGWSAWLEKRGSGVPINQHPELSPVWVRLLLYLTTYGGIELPDWLIQWIEERVTTEQMAEAANSDEVFT